MHLLRRTEEVPAPLIFFHTARLPQALIRASIDATVVQQGARCPRASRQADSAQRHTMLTAFVFFQEQDTLLPFWLCLCLSAAALSHCRVSRARDRQPPGTAVRGDSQPQQQAISDLAGRTSRSWRREEGPGPSRARECPLPAPAPSARCACPDIGRAVLRGMVPTWAAVCVRTPPPNAAARRDSSPLGPRLENGSGQPVPELRGRPRPRCASAPRSTLRARPGHGPALDGGGWPAFFKMSRIPRSCPIVSDTGPGYPAENSALA
jgi:hypothetical protein